MHERDDVSNDERRGCLPRRVAENQIQLRGGSGGAGTLAPITYHASRSKTFPSTNSRSKSPSSIPVFTSSYMMSRAFWRGTARL